MSEDEIDAYYDEMAEDARDEAAREEWEAERRAEYLGGGEEDLEETIRDADREYCEADYSGGRGPRMECTYRSETSSSPISWDNWAASLDGTFWGIVLVIALTVPFAIIILKPKNKKQKK